MFPLHLFGLWRLLDPLDDRSFWFNFHFFLFPESTVVLIAHRHLSTLGFFPVPGATLDFLILGFGLITLLAIFTFFFVELVFNLLRVELLKIIKSHFTLSEIHRVGVLLDW